MAGIIALSVAAVQGDMTMLLSDIEPSFVDSPFMPRDTQSDPRVLISRSALLHNVGVFRRAVPAGTKLCAMIKADAYGHSAAIVADTLCNFAGVTNGVPAVDAL